MQDHKLVAWNTGAVLFHGPFPSAKHCVEAAISAGIALDYLLVEDADLSAANLDNATFNYARFLRCDLRGANISESSLIKTEFRDCDLRRACLSDSVVVGARFNGSRMADVDVSYADLRGVLVTCAEFLKCDFSQTTHLGGGAFMAAGIVCAMTRPPVFIRGLGLDATLLDEHVVLGSTIILRRDQLASQDGLMQVFATHGLAPCTNQLANLWQAVRGERTHMYAA